MLIMIFILESGTMEDTMSDEETKLSPKCSSSPLKVIFFYFYCIIYILYLCNIYV